jgi:thiamine biosynthesis lipoprotein
MRFIPATRWLAAISFLFCGVFLLTACEQKPVQFTGETMGSSYHITVVDLPDGQTAVALEKDIAALLSDAHARLTTYDPASELNQFNQAPVGEWLTLSPILHEALMLSFEASVLTAGAFDPTVASLVNLWGFGPGKRTDTVPTDADIAKAQAQIGYAALELEAYEKRARKTRAITLDLSGMGHGYGADLVASYLDNKGVKNYLAEVAGESRTKGQRPGGGSWRLAIETPVAMQGEIFQALYLDNIGIATSGDYRNYFEKDGVRYSHTIDPKTGRPITHNLASVTVLDESAARADALATALLVLGMEKGKLLADSMAIPAFFIVRDGENFRGIATDTFKPYMNTK